MIPPRARELRLLSYTEPKVVDSSNSNSSSHELISNEAVDEKDIVSFYDDIMSCMQGRIVVILLG
jgi:hypothetical protein